MRPSLQRWGLGAAGLALLGGFLLFALARFGDAPEVPRPARPPPSTWSAQALAAPVPTTDTQSLGGQVLGPEGPVAGALVIALPAPSTAWRALSEPEWRPGGTCVRDSAVARFLEQVDTHRRDAVVLARSTTDAQGRFLLEGLGPEPLVLWAEKDMLLGVLEVLSAGGDEARVHVRPGVWRTSTVLDDTEAPVAGVRVTTRVRDAGRVLETVTGEDGRFVLGPLPDAEEPLLLSKPGFLTASYTPRMPAPRILMSRQHRLSGRVADERGPVAGATVQLEDLGELDAVLTDEQGHFALEGLCAGRHVLVARRAGDLARRWVDVAGQDGPPVDLFLVPSVRLSGRVTDPSGQALVEAGVSVSGGGEPPQTLSTKTDARGRFLLEPLVPGRHVVSAQAPHHALERVPARLYESSQELDLVLKRAELLEGIVVDERDAPVEGVQLRLAGVGRWEPASATSAADGRFLLEVARSGPIRVGTWHPGFASEDVTLSAPARDVRVVLRRSSTLETRMADAEGRPVANAEVLLGSASGRPYRRGRTDADGAARFHQLMPGDYTVQACARDSHAEPVRLTLGAQELRTLPLRLPRKGRLTGQVVDAEGRPVEGATLTLRADASRPVQCREPVSITSGAEGHFSLALAEGTWLLYLVAEGQGLDAGASRGVESTRGEASVRVRVLAGESRVQLVLLPSQSGVRGRVVHGDGRPVIPFRLNGREVHHPEGRFVLAVSNDMDLKLEAPGLTPFQKRLNASPTQQKDLDLGEVVLEPLRRVEGTVVDALSAAPVAQALVSSGNRRDPGAYRGAVAYTRPDGHFSLEGLLPTDTLLRIEHPRYPPLDVGFTPGQPLEVRLAPGATLEGRVESDGVPVERGTVQLRTPQGATVATTEVWKGRYLLELLPAGAYTVRFQGPRTQGATWLFPLSPVELAAGERRSLDFSGHYPGVSVEVRVLERNVDVYLMPGDFPPLSPRQGLHNKLLEGIQARRVSDTERHFPPVSGGNYTLIAVRNDEDTDVYQERVELPAEGSVSLQLTPIWNHYAE